jgi:predicted lipase
MVEAGKNNFNKLNCKQINLQHSKFATLHLCKLLVELKIDIALIQEPYAKRNILNDEIQIPSVPDVYAVHHSLNEDHAYGAAILVRKVLVARTVACMSSNEGIGIQLSSMSKNPVYLFSVYCRPSHKNLGSIIDPMAS